LTVLGFAVIHDILIVDIWFNIGPMVVAGAACGLCVAWSYDQAITDHSTRRWFAYNASCATLIVALGAASFLALDPQFTMAELMVADDALGKVIPPAVPLMIAATLVGTLILWVLFSRTRAAVIPILVTQILLVLLVGHNLAILGLVEMSSDVLRFFGEFVALTAFLAVGFAGGTALIASARSRVLLYLRQPLAEARPGGE
jgi:hypothetical protein